MSIMSKISLPNIVHFIEVSFDKHPRYIILELLIGGDFNNFFREEIPNLNLYLFGKKNGKNLFIYSRPGL